MAVSVVPWCILSLAWLLIVDLASADDRECKWELGGCAEAGYDAKYKLDISCGVGRWNKCTRDECKSACRENPECVSCSWDMGYCFFFSESCSSPYERTAEDYIAMQTCDFTKSQVVDPVELVKPLPHTPKELKDESSVWDAMTAWVAWENEKLKELSRNANTKVVQLAPKKKPVIPKYKEKSDILKAKMEKGAPVKVHRRPKNGAIKDIIDNEILTAGDKGHGFDAANDVNKLPVEMFGALNDGVKTMADNDISPPVVDAAVGPVDKSDKGEKNKVDPEKGKADFPEYKPPKKEKSWWESLWDWRRGLRRGLREHDECLECYDTDCFEGNSEKCLKCCEGNGNLMRRGDDIIRRALRNNVRELFLAEKRRLHKKKRMNDEKTNKRNRSSHERKRDAKVRRKMEDKRSTE